MSLCDHTYDTDMKIRDALYGALPAESNACRGVIIISKPSSICMDSFGDEEHRKIRYSEEEFRRHTATLIVYSSNTAAFILLI